jgi:hypothetical protein
MRLFRYRRPSLNTLLGITKVKKLVKKELSITTAHKVSLRTQGCILDPLHVVRVVPTAGSSFLSVGTSTKTVAVLVATV